jgi:tRNA(fMet)-specific endonuclease VapC
MLDTNICIYALQGGDEVLDARIAACDSGDLVMSMITRAELETGFEKAAAPESSRREADIILRNIPAVDFDYAAARAFGVLQASVSRGAPRIADRLIGAHALALKVVVVTNNERDFRDVPRLRVENWTKSGAMRRS